jgi:hypothetical protein
MEVVMRYGVIAIFAATILSGPAFADPWKDESGKGRWGHEGRGYRAYNMDREYKEEYRRGNCKVERKWERDGGYKEETKCKGYR